MSDELYGEVETERAMKELEAEKILRRMFATEIDAEKANILLEPLGLPDEVVEAIEDRLTKP